MKKQNTKKFRKQTSVSGKNRKVEIRDLEGKNIRGGSIVSTNRLGAPPDPVKKMIVPCV